MPRVTKVRTKRVRKHRVHRRIPRTLKAKENGPLSVRKTVSSKNFSSVTVTVSGGSLSFNNAGMLTATTPASQSMNYYSGGIAFTLTDIPEFTQYKALYDRWRIVKIQIRVYPFNTTSETPLNLGTQPVGATNPVYYLQPGNGSMAGMWHDIIDYDDQIPITATLAGLDSMLNRPSYRMRNLMNSTGKPITKTLRPRQAIAAYQNASGLFTGYSNQKAGWLDTAAPSDSILHYGYKFFIELLNPNNQVNYMNFKMEAVYHLQFKDPI